jgi:hypothetical protein
VLDFDLSSLLLASRGDVQLSPVLIALIFLSTGSIGAAPGVLFGLDFQRPRLFSFCAG